MNTTLKVLLSVFFVILCGSPIWYHTMTVHQTKLPTNKLLNLSSSANPKISIQIKLLFDEQILKTQNKDPFLSKVKKEVTKLSKEFQQEFLTFQINTQAIKLKKDYNNMNDPKKITKFLEESLSFHKEKENQKEKEKENNTEMFEPKYTLVLLNIPNLSEGIYLPPTGRLIWINLGESTNEDNLLNNLRNFFPIFGCITNTTKFTTQTDDLHLSFILLNQDPRGRVLNWEFEEAFNYYLQPTLEKLNKRFSEITFDSEMIAYADLEHFRVHKSNEANRNNEKGVHYSISKKTLRRVIQIGEWSSSVATNKPVLRFILFVPGQKFTPLFINKNSGKNRDAFIVPGIGGISIHNLNKSETQLLNKNDLRRSFLVFANQMRLFLGIKNLEKFNYYDPSNVIHDIELDMLILDTLIKNLNEAKHSLVSLHTLIEELPYMEIPEEIGTHIQNAINEIQFSESNMKKKNYKSAYFSSKRAIEDCNRAFFNPSISSQLYFEMQNRFAIYIPIFLPMLAPLITKLFKQISSF
ncbi:gpi transamidase component pig-s [Anaeramoeba flamelloides]|uniref:Gpi transamidase component pig-s n=1 Tax=Anaeramoeba flamelloides TaxID=1746091 RepID=A0ABQ8Y389_9EUKA|nr:gpi transamidase component pig-s [Anaeramoeba flamelloides]